MLGEQLFASNEFAPVPSDEFFKLAATTIRLRLPEGACPPSVGNEVLAFLQDEVKSIVQKVRPQKGWLSADVFLGGRMCTVKARFYLEPAGVHLVELQRRRGRSMDFNQIFRTLIASFESKSYGVLNAAMSSSGLRRGLRAPPLPPAMPWGGGAARAPISDLELEHLFNMMVVADAPSLQVEAFNSFRSLVKDQPRLAKAAPFLENAKHFFTVGVPRDREAEWALTCLLVEAAKVAGQPAAQDAMRLLAARSCCQEVHDLFKSELARVVKAC